MATNCFEYSGGLNRTEFDSLALRHIDDIIDAIIAEWPNGKAADC